MMYLQKTSRVYTDGKQRSQKKHNICKAFLPQLTQ